MLNSDCSLDCLKEPSNTLPKRTDYFYRKHLENMKKIKSTVDNKAPVLYVENVLKSGKIVEDFLRIRRITQENLNLLKRINVIYRTHGRVDHINKLAGIRRSKLPEREINLAKYEKENVKMLLRIINKSAVILTSELEADWKKKLSNIIKKCKQPIVLPELQEEQDDFLQSNPCLAFQRPRVFIELSIKNGRPLGRLSISLYNDIAPETSKIFYELCASSSLVNTEFVRIFPGLYAESSLINNSGMEAKISSGAENFLLSHKYTGTLTMNNQSQFAITFKPLSILDGKRMAFGRVVRGVNVLKSLEGCGKKHGMPIENVIISGCGIFKYK